MKSNILKKTFGLTLAASLVLSSAVPAFADVNITQGSGTAVATDAISGTNHQLIKIEYGAAGSATQASTTNPFPVIEQNAEKAEDAAHTSGDKGYMVFGVRETNNTDLSGNAADGDYEPFQVDALGRVKVAETYAATDGDTSFSNLGATSTGTSVLVAAAALKTLQLENFDSATRVIKIYDKATAATSSDTPVGRYVLTAGAHVSVNFGEKGLKLSNGLSVRATAEATDAGTTGAAANTIIANGTYK